MALKKDGTDTEKVKGNHFSYLAKKYKFASKILYISLAAVFVLTLIFNVKLLTYNNFSYLLRDIGTAADLASDNYNSISYSNDPLRTTKSYRGGIITASTTDMAIYTATGKRTMYSNESFISPAIASSKKYAVIYDLGGYNYSIFNSFSKVSYGSSEYPISRISVSDSGYYAIVSKDATHASVVSLYDQNFNLRNVYSFASKYVFASAMNSRGNRLAIITTESAADRFTTGICICEPGKDNFVAQINFSEGIPFDCAYNTSGDIEILCTDGFYVIDGSNGRVKNNYPFDGKKAGRFSLTDSGCAISFMIENGNSENEILVFDKNGKLIYNTLLESGMADIDYYGNCVFVNNTTSVLKINIKNGEISSEKISDNGEELIVYNESNILLCCQTKAKYIKIS